MHSTSLVLGKWLGCLRSVFSVLVSNIDRLLARAWCLLSAAFAVNSRHRTAAFIASHWYASLIVVTRKLQVGSRRALWQFSHRSQNKRKRNVHEWHNDGGVRVNLKTTIEVTIQVICVDLHAWCRWCRLACAARHQARLHMLHACLKAKVRTPCGIFWVAFDWCKQVKQVARSPWQL